MMLLEFRVKLGQGKAHETSALHKELWVTEEIYEPEKWGQAYQLVVLCQIALKTYIYIICIE